MHLFKCLVLLGLQKGTLPISDSNIGFIEGIRCFVKCFNVYHWWFLSIFTKVCFISKFLLSCRMAPEVIKSEDEIMYTQTIDVWSLGICCFEFTTGYPPHHAMHVMAALYHIPNNKPDLKHFRENYSQHFVDFVSECFKDYEDRPSSKFLYENVSAIYASLIDFSIEMGRRIPEWWFFFTFSGHVHNYRKRSQTFA